MSDFHIGFKLLLDFRMQGELSTISDTQMIPL